MSTTIAPPDTAATPLKGDVLPAETETPSGQRQAFDPAMYEDPDLRIDKIDGQNVQQIAVAFSGRVMLDRANPDHVRLYNSLTIGRDVELRVSAKSLGLIGKGATNREGDLDVLVGTRALKVDTLYVLAPEAL